MGRGLADVEHGFARRGAAGRSSQRSSALPPTCPSCCETASDVRYQQARQEAPQRALGGSPGGRPRPAGWTASPARSSDRVRAAGRPARPARRTWHGDLPGTREMLASSCSGLGLPCLSRHRRTSACKPISADKVVIGCPIARTVRQATGSSIQTGISWKRVTGTSTSEQRAAVPVARSITSCRRTVRPVQGCQA